MISSLSIDGIDLTIVDIQKNRQFSCDEECYNIDYCELKRAVGAESTQTEFLAVMVTLNVKNRSEKGWPIKLGNWELVDTDGYAYRAQNLCEELRPPRMMEADSWTVSPGTQVDFVLVFPELKKGKDVARLLYVSDNKINIFYIKELTPEAAALFEKRKK